jgi:hypothetical protein
VGKEMGGETNFSSHLELEVGKSRYFFFLDEAFFAAGLLPAFFAGFFAASFLAGRFLAFLVAIDNPPFHTAVAGRRNL